jgi:hypothetical protein
VFPDEYKVAELIRLDLQLHILRGEELAEFIKVNSALIPTLYFTAWAEIMANAAMFGGIESTSFKIKRKHLIAVGKKIWGTGLLGVVT